jgi:hypothetical protein
MNCVRVDPLQFQIPAQRRKQLIELLAFTTKSRNFLKLRIQTLLLFGFPANPALLNLAGRLAKRPLSASFQCFGGFERNFGCIRLAAGSSGLCCACRCVFGLGWRFRTEGLRQLIV